MIYVYIYIYIYIYIYTYIQHYIPNCHNIHRIFESNFGYIFPEELQLCRKNGNNVDANFLDLDIKIKSNKFQTSLECLENPVAYPQTYSTYQLELNV